MQPKPSLSLPGKARETLTKILDHVLAEECLLSATTRDYRWNVTGPNFHSLHKLFDEQRRQLDQWLDRIFERTRAAGLTRREQLDDLARGMAESTASGAGLPARKMIDDLLTRHEQLSRKLRDDVVRLGDPATAELLQRLADFHDTTAWILRMLLEGPDSGCRLERNAP
jgi:starvation-inducible DNA-binding protein